MLVALLLCSASFISVCCYLLYISEKLQHSPLLAETGTPQSWVLEDLTRCTRLIFTNPTSTLSLKLTMWSLIRNGEVPVHLDHGILLILLQKSHQAIQGLLVVVLTVFLYVQYVHVHAPVAS